MRFRTVAMAVALACASGMLAEAKSSHPKPIARKVKVKKPRKVKPPKAIKHSKVKRAKHA